MEVVCTGKKKSFYFLFTPLTNFLLLSLLNPLEKKSWSHHYLGGVLYKLTFDPIWLYV